MITAIIDHYTTQQSPAPLAFVAGLPARLGTLLGDMRRFHSLQREAHLCDATEPARAAALRGEAQRLLAR